MAPGRKHAPFRPRSQSDNGVIIELKPLPVGPRLVLSGSLSDVLLCGRQPAAGLRGEAPSVAVGGARRMRGLAGPVPCAAPTGGRSVVRRVGDLCCSRRSAGGRHGAGPPGRGWSSGSQE